MMKTIHELFTMISLCLFITYNYSAWVQEDYAAGYGAGANITTGTKNTFIGFKAGQKTTSGSENTFIGRGAGLNNKKGQGNIYMGVDAGHNGVENIGNIFIGNEAGWSSVESGNNIFIGFKAGYSQIDGRDNIFIGDFAGHANLEGFRNTFVGEFAGAKNISGHNNTFLGFEAGWENTEGYDNTMMGVAAGWANTTGYDNTFSGFFAGFNNNKGSENTFVGGYAGVRNNEGNKNTALGYRAGPIYGNNGVEYENATAIGYRAVVMASNALVLGSIKGVNQAESNTNVGIGIAAPKYQLHLSTNSAAKPGSSTWKVASDERLKKDIVDFTDGLSVINRIRPVKYRYNGRAGLPQDKEYVGVVAQEVQKVAPYMINSFAYQDSTGSEEEYLDFDATALTYMLINAIKEQQQKINELESKLKALEEGGAENLSDVVTLGNSSRLSQNVPNPYAQSTEIRYQVAEDAHSAFIKIYSIAGQEVATFDISGQVEGKVTLSSETIPMGTYIYQLWVDGQLKDSKKLIQTQ